MTISKYAVSKPTTVLLIFIILTALGIYSTISLPIDLLPDVTLPMMMVSTSYPNAGPEEVEKSVTRIVESSVSGVTGIEDLISTSSSGSSMVMLSLAYGTNLDEATNELRDRLDMIKGMLPADASSPVIFKMDPAMLPIMSLVVTGNRSAEELRQFAEDTLQPQLEQIVGVASASISGGRQKAIVVDIPRDRLEAYSLTISQIAQMIGAQNIQASGGLISEGDLNYTITTSGQFTSLDDIRNTVISYKVQNPSAPGMVPSVKSIKLRDIANVYEGYKDQTSLAYLDGVPGVMLTIQKQSGKNSVETAKSIRKKLVQLEKELPTDVQIIETGNTTDIIENSISQVSGSAIQGAVLAVIILFIFLRSFKSTLIIGLTIPISLVITLGVMYFAGFTLNVMTLAGLALGVGMLVDNSIVILENIYHYRERGTKAIVAAVLGSQEMVMAITSSTLTTVCVFLPLVLYKAKLGMIGEIVQGLAFTVVFSLLCSLAVAIVLVPVLASKYLKLENVKYRINKGFFGKINIAIGNALTGLDNAYARAVSRVLRHKTITIGVILVLFVASIVMIPKLGFIYMPSQPSDVISVNVTMPQGTKLSVTENVVRQLEMFAREEIQGIKLMSVSVGGDAMFGGGGTNSGVLQILLPEYKNRIDSEEVMKTKLRSHFDDFPGAELSLSSQGMSIGGGTPIDIIIKSDSLDIARQTANDIKNLLIQDGGAYVTEPQVGLTEGLPQMNIIIDRDRLYNLGLNMYSVSNEIKANINGVTASRYNDNGNEVDIIVHLEEGDRARLTDLDQIFVTNSNGSKIPLSSFASYEAGTSPVAINRENQARVIHVSANLAPGVTIDKAQPEVEKLIQKSIPQDENLTIEYGGDFELMKENLLQFAIIILMACVLVFAVMASQFESFLDPFIVMFTIPLSIVGIVIVYLIMGNPLNLLTAVGVLVLVGIIVNNGIVLVDYTNLLRKRGMPLREACIESAKTRLRPILMTTLTTVLGLLPMAFFPGEGSEMVQPIGQTVLGGLSFGTLMTLFLMPVMYYIFNSYRIKRNERKAARKEKRIEQNKIALKQQAEHASEQKPVQSTEQKKQKKGNDDETNRTDF